MPPRADLGRNKDSERKRLLDPTGSPPLQSSLGDPQTKALSKMRNSSAVRGCFESYGL